MANIISVTVYDFNTAGNALYGTKLMGLPVAGLHVRPVHDDERRTLNQGRTYVYSKIHYPNAAPASADQNGYFTAETVAQILTKANA